MGTIIKETMQIQFLALSLWMSIMLDLNGFSSVSYQEILVKYLFFFSKKKKNKTLRGKTNNSPFPPWKRCCEVRMNTRAGLEVEMSICAWAGYCFWARQQGPVNGSERTSDQHGDSARQSVSVSAGDDGALPRQAQPVGTAVTSAGKLSLFKPESRAECGLPGRDLLRMDS